MTDLTFGEKYTFTNTGENAPDGASPDPDNGSVVTLRPLEGLLALLAQISPEGAPVGFAEDSDGETFLVWEDELTPVEA